MTSWQSLAPWTTCADHFGSREFRVIDFGQWENSSESDEAGSKWRHAGVSRPQHKERDFGGREGLEPLTPCLQIQKTNLETEKKNEKE